MKIETRRASPIPVLALQGRVTIGPSSAALGSALNAAIDSGPPHLVLEASRVEYLDSSGLGELIAAARRLRETGGRLAIASPSPKLREILEITKLDQIFLVRETETEALDGLAPGQGPHGPS